MLGNAASNAHDALKSTDSEGGDLGASQRTPIVVPDGLELDPLARFMVGIMDQSAQQGTDLKQAMGEHSRVIAECTAATQESTKILGEVRTHMERTNEELRAIHEKKIATLLITRLTDPAAIKWVTFLVALIVAIIATYFGVTIAGYGVTIGVAGGNP